MGAKATRKKTPTLATLTAKQRATLEPLIVRCALAAMAQSKAEVAYEKGYATSATSATSAQRNRAMMLGGVADDAQSETCAAGAALARALRGAK